jgi:hypothetical protein
MYITCPLNVLDVTAVEFVKSTEWLPNSPDLNSLNFHVSNELAQFAYKNQIVLFKSLELLNKEQKIYGLLDHKVTSNWQLSSGKNGFRSYSKNRDPIQHCLQ